MIGRIEKGLALNWKGQGLRMTWFMDLNWLKFAFGNADGLGFGFGVSGEGIEWKLFGWGRFWGVWWLDVVDNERSCIGVIKGSLMA